MTPSGWQREALCAHRQLVGVCSRISDYYTFVSILGLAAFFDLGLDYVVVQFTSHEMAALKWSPQGKLEGDPVAKARLAGIFRLSLKWYGVAGLLTIALVGPVGFWFFAQRSAQHPEVLWQTPWVWAAVTAGIGLCASPVLAVLEGTGLVAEVGRLRLTQATGSWVIRA